MDGASRTLQKLIFTTGIQNIHEEICYSSFLCAHVAQQTIKLHDHMLSFHQRCKSHLMDITSNANIYSYFTVCSLYPCWSMCDYRPCLPNIFQVNTCVLGFKSYGPIKLMTILLLLFIAFSAYRPWECSYSYLMQVEQVSLHHHKLPLLKSVGYMGIHSPPMWSEQSFSIKQWETEYFCLLAFSYSKTKDPV